MKHNTLYPRLIVWLTLITLMILPGITYSASSENYQVIESQLGAGGGRMESDTYTATTIHGHPINGIEMRSSQFGASSGFIASTLPAIQAEIDIDPDTLNLKSKGRWITCYITFPEGYPKEVFIPEQVALTMVNGKTLKEYILSDLDAISPEQEDQIQYQDTEETEEYLKVKFIRSQVQAVVPIGEQIELTVTGNLRNGASFQGTGVIRVIDQGESKGKQGKKKE